MEQGVDMAAGDCRAAIVRPFVHLVAAVRLLAKPGAAATAMPVGAALVAPVTALEVALGKCGHRETTRVVLVTTGYVMNQIL